MNIASIELDFGQIASALDHAGRAAELARLTSNKEAEVISMLLVAGVHRERGELEKAKEIMQEAAALAEKTGIVRNHVLARKGLGIICGYMSDFDSAIGHFTEAAREAQRCGFYLLETMILADLSSAEIRRGDIMAGIARAQSALKAAESMGSKMVVGNAWHWIGAGHQELKQYDSALNAFQHALEKREAVEHCRGKAETYHKLAEVQLALRNRNAARESYIKSLEGFRLLGNESLANQVESALKTAEA